MTKREKVSLTAIILFAFIYRLYILLNTPISFYSDDAIYASLARFFYHGNFASAFHPTWPPLYPFVSSISYMLVRNWEFAMQLVSTISGVLIVIPLYTFSRIFLSKPIAFIFLATIPFFTPYLSTSLIPMSDSLATLLLVTAVAQVTIAIKKERIKPLLISAFFFGLTYLTRSEGSLFFFLTLGFLIIYLLYRKIFSRPEKIFLSAKAFVFFIIIFLVTISPYAIATKYQLGKWTLSQKFSAQVKQDEAFKIRKKGNTWSQEVVSIKEPNYKSEFFGGGLEHIVEHSDWYWFLFVQRLGKWQQVLTKNFSVWSLPIFAVGIGSIFRNKYFWPISYLTIISSIATLATVFGTPISDPRYLLWLIPIILMFIYIGVGNITKLIRLKALNIPFVVVITLLLPILNLNAITDVNGYMTSYSRNYYRKEIKEAGSWIKRNSGSSARIMMRHEGVEFYADGVTIYTPQELTLTDTLAYAEDYNIDYFIAWTEELIADKNLSVLLSENTKHQNLEEVFRTEENGRVLVIYKTIF